MFEMPKSFSRLFGIIILKILESDYISWAIASVQAIAEFHFFDIAMSPEMKPKDYIPMKCSTFKYDSYLLWFTITNIVLRNFWETGVPRIGDDFAMGINGT